MLVRKIAATYIFPGNRPPIKNGILICKTDGTIVDIIDNHGELTEESGMEFYSGILTPGFVNAHCHLEFSYLQGKIAEHGGLGDFIGQINRLRNEEKEQVEKSIQVNDRKMWAAGIAAVGDVSNSTLTLETKQKSRIFYHTFVESFGFHPSRANKSFQTAQAVFTAFTEKKLSASIVPHASYSVSNALFEKIKTEAIQTKSVLSIHNQESEEEAEFFKTGTGAIANHLQKNLNIDISHYHPGGKSSLSIILRQLPAQNRLLFVHNTFTKKDDLEEIRKNRSPENTHFVLCPNSNLFIENQLPPLSLFQNEKLNICLGTDSLASNQQLSILAEMITLQQNFENVELSELIKWATINGAKALEIDEHFGSFDTGKNPGINLITGIDLKTLKLNGNSKIKRLV